MANAQWRCDLDSCSSSIAQRESLNLNYLRTRMLILSTFLQWYGLVSQRYYWLGVETGYEFFVNARFLSNDA